MSDLEVAFGRGIGVAGSALHGEGAGVGGVGNGGGVWWPGDCRWLGL